MVVNGWENEEEKGRRREKEKRKEERRRGEEGVGEAMQIAGPVTDGGARHQAARPPKNSVHASCQLGRGAALNHPNCFELSPEYTAFAGDSLDLRLGHVAPKSAHLGRAGGMVTVSYTHL